MHYTLEYKYFRWGLGQIRCDKCGRLIYFADTDEKFAHFDGTALGKLGVTVDAHEKIPDVIIHCTKKNWLVLVEAVTSYGPINPKRKGELEKLFIDRCIDRFPLCRATDTVGA